MKFRGLIEVVFDVEADDEAQAREDAAVKLIYMIRNDEVAINLWPVGGTDAAQGSQGETK